MPLRERPFHPYTRVLGLILVPTNATPTADTLICPLNASCRVKPFHGRASLEVHPRDTCPQPKRCQGEAITTTEGRLRRSGRAARGKAGRRGAVRAYRLMSACPH